VDAFRGCPRPRGVGVDRSLEEQKHGQLQMSQTTELESPWAIAASTPATARIVSVCAARNAFQQRGLVVVDLRSAKECACGTLSSRGRRPA